MKAISTSPIIRQTSDRGIIRGNLLVTIIIFAVLIGLFFIPELLDLGREVAGSPARSASSGDASVDPSSSDSELVPVSDRGSYNLSPLETVLNEMDSLRDSDQARASLGPDADILKQGDARAKEAESLSQKEISWDTFNTREVIQILRHNQNQLTILLKKVDEKHVGTRDAIRNMRNGINYILDDAEREMTAQQAVDYISDLDKKIESEMIRERVNRDNFMEWRQVSFGPLFEQTKLDRRKARPPFRPHFTLAKVRIVHFGAFGAPNPKREPLLNILPCVKGDDIKDIIIYHNGEKLKRLIALEKTDEQGFRKIVLRQLSARGRYKFEIYDKYGEVVVKRYEFYNKARKHLTWDVNTQQYKIPFGYGLRDPRLDRFFSVGAGGQDGGLKSETLMAFAGKKSLFQTF